MQIGDIEFKFGLVNIVYSDEKKATVRLKNDPNIYNLYSSQKEKALKTNIGTKIAITKKNGFYGIMRLGTYKKIPTEDGSGIRYVWFAPVINVRGKSLLTSLGFFKNDKFGMVHVYCKVDTPEKYKSKDSIIIVLNEDNLPVPFNDEYYKVIPDKIIKVM